MRILVFLGLLGFVFLLTLSRSFLWVFGGTSRLVVLGLLVLLVFVFVDPMKRRGESRRPSPAADDEADRELMREIGRMVENMESRIDALETILTDREKSGQNPLD